MKGKGEEAGCQRRGVDLGLVQAMASPFSRGGRERSSVETNITGAELTLQDHCHLMKIGPQ